MGDYVDSVGRAIDYETEAIARAIASPFSHERSAVRARISLSIALDLISGAEPRAVLASLQALRARLAEPAKLPRLPRPANPVTPVRP